MGLEVFSRYENKYLLPRESYDQLLARLPENMAFDEYSGQHSAYQVMTLYYDTAQNDLIRTSLDRPRYKEKLRLRAYGTPTSHDSVFIEIKKKISGIVSKRRGSLSLETAYSFLETGALPDQIPEQQVFHEVAYILQRRKVVPALLLSYDRTALRDLDGSGLRISFDWNILSRRHDLRLELGAYGDELIARDMVLMEIKVKKSIPVWLVNLLSELGIYSHSFSKYGTEYIRYIQSNERRKQLVN